MLPFDSMVSLIGLVVLTLLVQGGAYAFQIYVRPFPQGWTALSVVIGVIFTVVGIAFAMLVTLLYFGLGWLWWIVLYMPVAFLITGLPQIYVDYRKLREQQAENSAKIAGL